MPKHRPQESMRLTPAHVAKVHRDVIDPGPLPGIVQATEEDYRAWTDRMLAAHPAPDRPTELFAYGSLIWKPEIAHDGERMGVARGWHRSFCFKVPRYRGSPDWPGLMMALDRGGQCKGVLYRLPKGDLAEHFMILFRREFSTIPPNSMPAWIKVMTEDGPVTALAFVMNRSSALYAGRQDPDTVADILARACGHWGSGAEYLMNTVTHLEARGIRDRNLWDLQARLAARIETIYGP